MESAENAAKKMSFLAKPYSPEDESPKAPASLLFVPFRVFRGP